MQTETFKKKYPTLLDRTQQSKYWLDGSYDLIKVKDLSVPHALNILGYLIRKSVDMWEAELRFSDHPLNVDGSSYEGRWGLFAELGKDPVDLVYTSPLGVALRTHVADKKNEYLTNKARTQIFGDNSHVVSDQPISGTKADVSGNVWTVGQGNWVLSSG